MAKDPVRVLVTGAAGASFFLLYCRSSSLPFLSLRLSDSDFLFSILYRVGGRIGLLPNCDLLFFSLEANFIRCPVLVCSSSSKRKFCEELQRVDRFYRKDRFSRSLKP